MDRGIRQIERVFFFHFLNEFHPAIKFNVDYSKNSINFADVKVSKSESGNTLCTNLFTKPTDTHHYLHATSCHHQFIRDLYLMDKQSE